MNVSFNHPILVQLREKGIPFNVCGPDIELDGFGKAGIVRLKAGTPVSSLLLCSRYERIEPVWTFDEVVAEAWHWLGVTISKNNDLYCVHENWRQAFIDRAWLPVNTREYAGITREMWDAGEKIRRYPVSV